MLSSFPHQMLYQSYPTFPLHSGDKAPQFPATFVSKNGDMPASLRISLLIAFLLGAYEYVQTGGRCRGECAQAIFQVDPDCVWKMHENFAGWWV